MTPSERRDARARAIAAAVRAARERRGVSLRELASRTDVSASTLSRIEKPDAASSPSVDTLEALVDVLECPLAELLGEQVEIEYRGIGEWPEALHQVMRERGGYVTAAERAFLEERLGTLRETSEKLGRDPARQTEAADDPGYWRQQIRHFHESPTWRIVDYLVSYSELLPFEAVQGLHLIVRSLVGEQLGEALAQERAVVDGGESSGEPKEQQGDG